MRIQLCLLAAMAALPFPAGAQTAVTSSAVSATGAAMHGTMRMSARRFAGTPITGAPYSAQRVTEHVLTAADGTRFTTNTQLEKLYRDSQGRTRTERPLAMGPNAPDAPLLVEISDPVANVGYTLDTQNKVAHRVAYDAPPSRFGGAGVGRTHRNARRQYGRGVAASRRRHGYRIGPNYIRLRPPSSGSH